MRIDTVALHREAAAHSHRHLLTALKHAEDLPLCQQSDWPMLVCSKSAFVEAIFSGKAPLHGVEAVMLSRTLYDEWHHYAFEHFCDKLTDERRFLVETFATVHQKLKRHNIELADVADV